MAKNTAHKAFTLIELLVIILIVALLIMVAAPSFLSQQTKAQDSKTQQELTVVRKALKAIWTSDEKYPSLGTASDTNNSIIGQLKQSEPSYSFTVYNIGSSPATGVFSVDRASGDSVSVCGQSQSGRWFCLQSFESNAVNELANVSFVSEAEAASVTTRKSSGKTEADARAALSSAAGNSQLADAGAGNSGVPYWSQGAGSSTVNAQSQAQAVLVSSVVSRPNLVSYWKMDNPAVLEDIKGTNNGTYNQAALINSGFSPSTGNSSSFTGNANSYASVPNNASLNSSSFTIETTVKFNSFAITADTSGYIIYKANTTAGRFEQYALKAFNNNTVAFIMGDGTNQSAVTSNALQTGKWYSFAMSYNAPTNTMSLYQDGSIVDQKIFYGPVRVGSQPLMFGRAKNSLTAFDGYFDGSIDDTAYYNNAQSSSNICAHYIEAGGANNCNVVLASSYKAQVDLDNPVAFWRFNDANTSSVMQDTAVSGNNLNGTYNTVSGISLDAPGAIGDAGNKSMNLNGTGGYGQVPNNSLINPSTGSFSVELWVKPNSFINNPNVPGYLLFKGNGQTGWFEGYTLILWNGGASFTMTTGTTQRGATSAANSLIIGQWAHVVGTYDNQFIRIYVNGVLQGETPYTGPVQAANTPLIFGRTNVASFDGKLNGSLDDAAFYNKALTPMQVCAHYRAGSGNSNC